jgi:hypothetical protein
MPKHEDSSPEPTLGALPTELSIAQSAGQRAGPLAHDVAGDRARIRDLQGADEPAAALHHSVEPGSGAPDQDERHPRLGADLQAVIGQQLRAVYHEVLNEPVPERFVRLLEVLATKQADHP